MPDIKKTLQLTKVEYYKTHLSIVNCVLPDTSKMTPTEIKVLANFMALEGDIAINKFGPTGKKVVMKALDISDAGLSNYLKQLTDKDCVRKKGDTLIIHPLLEPQSEQQIYMFRLINLN